MCKNAACMSRLAPPPNMILQIISSVYANKLFMLYKGHQEDLGEKELIVSAKVAKLQLFCTFETLAHFYIGCKTTATGKCLKKVFLLVFRNEAHFVYSYQIYVNRLLLMS